MVKLKEHILPPNYPDDVLQTIHVHERNVSVVSESNSPNPLELGDLTRLDRNSNAKGILSMMSLVAFSDEGRLGIEEIIANRQTGAPPARTEYEIGLLVKSGLMLESSGNYYLSDLGKIEIKRNEMMNPKHANEILNRALEDIKANPPNLPPEVYSKEEFRWSWDTVKNLIERILKNNAYRKLDIALLGAPTVALFLSKCPELVNHVSMFDINSEMVNLVNDLNVTNIHAAHYDAIYPIHEATSHNYDVVITDPPWHVEHYMLFVDRAWEWLRPLGEAYVAFFSHETRPEAGSEIKALRGRFDNGFEQWGFEERFFGYEIPSYEAAAFSKQGVHAIKRANYGALMHLVREPGSRSETCLTQEAADKLISEHTIKLFAAKANKHLDVYVRKEELEIQHPAITGELLSGGEIFPNTSRSSRREANINLMDEHHHAWRVNYPGLFAIAAQQLLDGANQDDVMASLLILGSEEGELSNDFADAYVQMVRDFLSQQGLLEESV